MVLLQLGHGRALEGRFPSLTCNSMPVLARMHTLTLMLLTSAADSAPFCLLHPLRTLNTTPRYSTTHTHYIVYLLDLATTPPYPTNLHLHPLHKPQKTSLSPLLSSFSYTATMPVRLRLARVPLTRNSPRYTLVATNSISRNSALPLETLGTYNPIPTLPPPVARSPNGQIRSVKEWGARQALKVGPQQTPGEKSVQWNEGRVKWWLQQGAVPTKSVEKLLVRAGLLSE